MQSKETDYTIVPSIHWNTPDDWLELGRQVLGHFDLDPCSNDWSTVGAKREIKPPDDGLAADWLGNIWLNPPFGRELPKWIAKASESYAQNNAQILAVIPNATATRYFQNLVYGTAVAICYPKGRIRFRPNPLTPKDGDKPRDTTVIVYWGDSPALFKSVFESKGHVDILKPEKSFERVDFDSDFPVDFERPVFTDPPDYHPFTPVTPTAPQPWWQFWKYQRPIETID